MTPEQVQLVRLSFVSVMNIKLEAGRLFYDRLFAIAPEVRPMFKGDIETQSKKLMDTLALAIGTLKSPTALQGMLDGLARRHTDYGVRDEHYDKVGEALLWTLEKGLGPDFTSEVKAAWAALYATVSSRMKMATQQRAATA
jgi:nitric oxide dioxygenase